MVGGRDGDYAIALMNDLRQRIVNRVKLTTYGYKVCIEVVDEAFGIGIDYAIAVIE